MWTRTEARLGVGPEAGACLGHGSGTEQDEREGKVAKADHVGRV